MSAVFVGLVGRCQLAIWANTDSSFRQGTCRAGPPTIHCYEQRQEIYHTHGTILKAGGCHPPVGASLNPNRFRSYLHSVGQELEDLDRFVGLNRQAFHKILKKYKKWTGSPDLAQRFNENVLSRPTSFATKDFVSTLAHYNEILASSREAKSRIPSPRPNSASTRSTDGPTDSGFSVRLESSGTSAPDTVQQQEPVLPRKKRKLRRESLRRKIHDPLQRLNIRYWNEFDDGESPDDNAYTIYVDPNASVFPGAATISRFAEATAARFKSLLSRDKPPAADPERQPLLDDSTPRSSSDEDSDLEDGSTLSPYRAHPNLPTASYSSSRQPPHNPGGKWLRRACIACSILLLVLMSLGAIVFWS